MVFDFLRSFGVVKKMRKFHSKNLNIHDITFKGVKYSFIVDQKGVGVRRKDNKTPHSSDVEALTEYLFEEGWANREDYEENSESWS